MKKKIIIGVTGALATGKTTASDMFASKGAFKIDADGIAHKLLEEDERIIAKVLDLFGREILTGSKIDRKKLAGKVFSDKEKLKKLSGIMHPEIIRRIKEETAGSNSPVVVIDAPLLVETNLHDYVDIVVVVRSSAGTQIKRAKNRGISSEEAKRIIEEQLPLSEKAKFADYVIDNDSGLEKIKKGVEEIWKNVQKERKS